LRRVELNWFNLGQVKALYHILKPDDYFKNPAFPELNDYGVYMYLDRDSSKIRYIGQAYGSGIAALGSRIRWEVVKDGKDCAESAFYQKCKKYNVDRFNLILKVAHLKNPQKDGISVQVDDKFVNAVERALIFNRAQEGDPLMNETGKTSYRLGPIEITNTGHFVPLLARIVL
jgi:hypothetical protein